MAASGVGSARHSRAGAVAAGRCLALDGRQFGSGGHAHHERVAGMSRLALAVVAARCVDADGVGAASVADTFVDICNITFIDKLINNGNP